MRTFGTEKNYAVWNNQVTETLLQERTASTRFPINPDEVMPRYLKAKDEQKSRTGESAEVFTPYELVKKMNDQTQKDLPKDAVSGLDVAMKVLSRVDEIGFVKLTNQDVVRHPLVQKIVKAYEDYENRVARRTSRKSTDNKEEKR